MRWGEGWGEEGDGGVGREEEVTVTMVDRQTRQIDQIANTSLNRTTSLSCRPVHLIHIMSYHVCSPFQCPSWP